ncbi:MAG: hypothetical protein M3Y86_07650, partial [Verrucomicrobiota bacterium]|nr:hypothetical protein [Verrucomicrobiota bacterium]
VDHETQASGPYAGTPPATATYPASGPKRAVYYASQSVSDARTSRSDNGGVTFGPAIPMYTTADCGGLHGHLKVTPANAVTLANGHAGTVYLPNNACGGTSDPVGHVDGQQAAVVSEDNGLNWNIRKIPNSDTKSDRDPSIGIATDGTAYMGMQSADGHARIALTHDKGVTWTTPLDVGVNSAAVTGAPEGGINNIVFPEVVAGDGEEHGPNTGRAAFAFFGTTTAGNDYDQPTFAGVWYLYISTTYDSGQHWTTVNLTPNDPIQRGGICGSGTCRNLLDFFDASIDKEGRILVGWDDGCVGGCVNGGNNSFTSKASITRQSGGPRMFAAYDTQANCAGSPPVCMVTLPGAPAVSGVLTGSTVNLSWPVPDNGGAAITGYRVSKGTGGTFTQLAVVTVPNYTDPAFVAGQTYRVTAINSVGEGPYCHDFAPATGPVATACTIPGILAIDDTTSTGADNDSAQNTPADPRVNIKQLFVAEPFVNPATEQFVFTLKVASSTAGAAPANSQWLIIWNRQGTQPADPNDSKYDRLYVAMVTDATGTPTFEYGKFGIPINTSPPPLPDPSANAPVKAGAADSGSYDPLTGVITITLSKSKLRTIDGGSTKYNAGSDLPSLNVRTYFNRPDYNSDPNSAVRSQRSQNNASDITDNSTYSIRGNQVCAPAPQLLGAVSRKVHGAAGPFDIRLFPAAGAAVSEPRTGGGNGSYQVVVTFAAPVTLGTPTTDAGNVASSSVNGNDVIINLTNVPDQRTTTITLPNVTAGGAGTTVSVPLHVLIGDSNDDGSVNSGDAQQTRGRSGQLASGEEGRNNFRSDLNFDGTINSGDASIARANSGHPTSPRQLKSIENAKRQ